MYALISVGDATIDAFIKINDAHVQCTINKESCELCLKYGDKIAVEEMQHAERLAERLDYLGGTPTTQPEKIVVGLELKKMMELDAKAESDTIKVYKEALEYCAKINDPVSRRLFEDLLVDEEDHHNFFETMLEGN